MSSETSVGPSALTSTRDSASPHPQEGLTSDQAQERLTKDGPNAEYSGEAERHSGIKVNAIPG